MRGWFDAFREGGGPTLYESDRTAAAYDNILIALFTASAALFLAFLLIIPGIRRNKIPTFLLMTASMYVLSSIVICRFSSNWHVSSSSLLAAFQRNPSQKLPGIISVHIGLESFNVTLHTDTNTTFPDSMIVRGLHFNERYTWSKVDEVKELYQHSLEKGLPYPVLTMAEVLSLDQGSFSWGRSYRQAGYYSMILLWSALATWAVTNVLFCLVPRYSGYFMLITGGLLFGCNGVYSQLIPSPPLTVRFEQGVLQFSYGWCFWMVLVAGFVSTSFGIGTIITDLFFPQLLTSVHASWKQRDVCSADFPYPVSRKPATAISSIVQLYDSPSRNYSSEPVLPSYRSTKWTSQIASCSMDSIDGADEDMELEQIHRASNLPFCKNRNDAANLGRVNPAFVGSPEPEGNLDRRPIGFDESYDTSGIGSSIGGGDSNHTDPVTWDVNVVTEDVEEQSGETTRL